MEYIIFFLEQNMYPISEKKEEKGVGMIWESKHQPDSNHI